MSIYELRELVTEWRAREAMWSERGKDPSASDGERSRSLTRANCFGLCAEELERVLEAA